LNIYPGRKPVFHLDAYRTSSPEDFQAVGLEELLEGGGITVIEWAERIHALLPEDRLEIFIDPGEAPEERLFRLVGRGEAAGELLRQLAGAWGAS